MTDVARTSAGLAALRGRLQAQCRVPALPEGWWWESATLSAEGLDYGGDFFVADLVDLPDGPGLQMVLVDTCGHGARALPDAVQLAGAIRGLIGVLPPSELMSAINSYLYRLGGEEAFATAAQVVVCFKTGRYEIRNAGHPPVLRWNAAHGEWTVDGARGVALGVQPATDLVRTEGVLGTGEALMFYTDGVVETRTEGIDVGIDRLRASARAELTAGWQGLADRLLAGVRRGADDRAVLLLGHAGI